MIKSDFKKLYDKHTISHVDINLIKDSNLWDNQLNKWKEYEDLIKSVDGLPIKRWLKNDTDGYLPDFLEKKEKCFGHAKPGFMTNNMIYFHTGDEDPNKQNKYYDGYKGKDSYFDNIDDIKDDYNEKIKKLLKNIVNANTLDELYEVEKSDEYKDYTAKQILRKISILMSLKADSPYKNAFVWIYSKEVIKKLAYELDVEYDEDDEEQKFLKNNHLVYERAKEYVGIDDNSSRDDIIKLYDLLWELGNEENNVTVLSDFRSINVIFNGAPGTGKTYGVSSAIEELQNKDGNKYKDAKYIQFHPSFTYQDFIEGIKPLGIKGNNIDLQVVNGSFKEFCIYVRKENEEYYNNLTPKPNIKEINEFFDWPHYYFIVDEINRGDLSNIFGETFTLLEADYRDYDFSGNYKEKSNKLVSTALSNVIGSLENNDNLVYKKIGNEVCFGIPFNIHFIGMMNDVDRSIDAFDLALRRRFKWISKNCDYDVIENVLIEAGYNKDEVEKYCKSCKELNNFICFNKEGALNLGKTYEIGHAFFLKIRFVSSVLNKVSKEKIFDTYISGTIKEYIKQVKDENQIDTTLEKARGIFIK